MYLTKQNLNIINTTTLSPGGDDLQHKLERNGFFFKESNDKKRNTRHCLALESV